MQILATKTHLGNIVRPDWYHGDVCYECDGSGHIMFNLDYAACIRCHGNKTLPGSYNWEWFCK